VPLQLLRRARDCAPEHPEQACHAIKRGCACVKMCVREEAFVNVREEAFVNAA
jgi:hypothetical protein